MSFEGVGSTVHTTSTWRWCHDIASRTSTVTRTSDGAPLSLSYTHPSTLDLTEGALSFRLSNDGWFLGNDATFTALSVSYTLAASCSAGSFANPDHDPDDAGTAACLPCTTVCPANTVQAAPCSAVADTVCEPVTADAFLQRDVVTCASTGDPHIRTLFGRRTHHYGSGTAVLVALPETAATSLRRVETAQCPWGAAAVNKAVAVLVETATNGMMSTVTVSLAGVAIDGVPVTSTTAVPDSDVGVVLAADGAVEIKAADSAVRVLVRRSARLMGVFVSMPRSVRDGAAPPTGLCAESVLPARCATSAAAGDPACWIVDPASTLLEAVGEAHPCPGAPAVPPSPPPTSAAAACAESGVDPVVAETACAAVGAAAYSDCLYDFCVTGGDEEVVAASADVAVQLRDVGYEEVVVAAEPEDPAACSCLVWSHGACVGDVGDAMCTCDAGYTSPACECAAHVATGKDTSPVSVSVAHAESRGAVIVTYRSPAVQGRTFADAVVLGNAETCTTQLPLSRFTCVWDTTACAETCTATVDVEADFWLTCRALVPLVDLSSTQVGFHMGVALQSTDTYTELLEVHPTVRAAHATTSIAIVATENLSVTADAAASLATLAVTHEHFAPSASGAAVTASFGIHVKFGSAWTVVPSTVHVTGGAAAGSWGPADAAETMCNDATGDCTLLTTATVTSAEGTCGFPAPVVLALRLAYARAVDPADSGTIGFTVTMSATDPGVVCTPVGATRDPVVGVATVNALYALLSDLPTTLEYMVWAHEPYGVQEVVDSSLTSVSLHVAPAGTECDPAHADVQQLWSIDGGATPMGTVAVVRAAPATASEHLVGLTLTSDAAVQLGAVQRSVVLCFFAEGRVDHHGRRLRALQTSSSGVIGVAAVPAELAPSAAADLPGGVNPGATEPQPLAPSSPLTVEGQAASVVTTTAVTVTLTDVSLVPHVGAVEEAMAAAVAAAPTATTGAIVTWLRVVAVQHTDGGARRRRAQAARQDVTVVVTMRLVVDSARPGFSARVDASVAAVGDVLAVSSSSGSLLSELTTRNVPAAAVFVAQRLALTASAQAAVDQYEAQDDPSSLLSTTVAVVVAAAVAAVAVAAVAVTARRRRRRRGASPAKVYAAKHPADPVTVDRPAKPVAMLGKPVARLPPKPFELTPIETLPPLQRQTVLPALRQAPRVAASFPPGDTRARMQQPGGVHRPAVL